MKSKDIWMGIAFILIGILVLARPTLLLWFVGIGFIVVGILQILGKR
ncbi:MAG: DUF3096 domain-containing protein [Chloroflexota bacterium]